MDPTRRDAHVDDILALLPPLFATLERLAFVGRHFHPPHFAELMAAVGEPDAAVSAERARLDAWPVELADVRDTLALACDEAVAGFQALRQAQDDPEGRSSSSWPAPQSTPAFCMPAASPAPAARSRSMSPRISTTAAPVP
jgi:hypothetical protein